MREKYLPFVSVIIPVYNDAERLKLCLNALENQTYPRDCYEVIVVDNGSDESIELLIAQFPQAKAAYEVQPGAYAARNTGISLAQGDVLAFTDSDCIPAPDWLEKGGKHVASMGKPGILGGNVQMFFHDSEHPTGVELFDAVVMGFDQRKNVEINQFSVTANLFAPCRIFQQIGAFDPTLKSRGDLEWGRRAASRGYTMHYDADVKVLHPTRSSFRQLYRRMVRLTGGFEDVLQKNETLMLPHECLEYSFSLRPSVETLRLIWSRCDLNVCQKAHVTLIGMAVKCIKMRERLRLKIGGMATR